MRYIIVALVALCIPLTGCISLQSDMPMIYDKPVIKSFSAVPASINASETSALQWSVVGATNVSIDQGVGNVALTGQTSVSPSVTTVYTLTAANSFGSTSARTQITVPGTQDGGFTDFPKRPVINYFVASPLVIIPGSSATLSWKITDATDIKLDPDLGQIRPEMSLQIKPVQATTYTLTATNQVGSDSVSVTITLVPVTSTGPQSGNTAVLYLASSESGSLVKNAAAYSKSPAVCAGDNAQNLASRAFLSYDITSIPPSAIIQGAELDFGAYALSGNPTYSSAMWGNMGALEVYRSQYGKYEDPGRIAYEFPAPPLGSLHLTGDISSRLKLDVTVDGDGVNVIQQLMADGQSRCQFRVQFFTSTNWDGKADLICLDEATLIVKYSVP